MRIEWKSVTVRAHAEWYRIWYQDTTAGRCASGACAYSQSVSCSIAARVFAGFGPSRELVYHLQCQDGHTTFYLLAVLAVAPSSRLAAMHCHTQRLWRGRQEPAAPGRIRRRAPDQS